MIEQVTGRAPGPSPISQMSTESYSDMLRRELDSRFLNSTPNMSSLLPPPPLSATPGPNKLLDPSSLYRPMMPHMGLPGLNPSPYPPHSVGYGVNSVPSSAMSVSSAMGQPQSGGGILSNLGGMSLPPAPSSLSLPPKVCYHAVHVVWLYYHACISQLRHRNLASGMPCTSE